MNTVSLDIYTFATLLLVGLFFVYFGWSHRASLGRPEPGSLRKTVEPHFLIPSLFVVIGSGEIGLAVSLLLVFGLGGISFLLGLAAAMFAIAIIMPRISAAVSQFNFTRVSYNGYHSYTTPDFIFHRFGRICSIGATGITALAFWGILMLQLLVGGAIIDALTGANGGSGTVLITIIVALYTTLGGFAAIYLTDLWQSILMWVALTIVTTVLFLSHGSIETFSIAQENFSNLTSSNVFHPTVIALFCVTLIAAFGGPDLWQRANMATAPRMSLVVAGISVVLFSLLIAAFSIDIQVVLGTQAEVSTGNELVQYLKLVVSSDASSIPTELVWPDWLRIIIGVGFLSAFISTADTSAMLVATSIQNEINRLGDESVINASERNTQIIIVISCVSAALVSIFATNLAAAFTAILGILGVLGLPTFLGLLGRGNSGTCIFAFVGGALIILAQAYFLAPQYNDGWWLLLPLSPGVFGLFFRSR